MWVNAAAPDSFEMSGHDAVSPRSGVARCCSVSAFCALLQIVHGDLRSVAETCADADPEASDAQVEVMGTLQNGVMDPEEVGPSPDSAPGSSVAETLSPEKTLDLLTRVKSGDPEALERLVARCLPPLRRWAHGRLPRYARDMQDTADLVQDTIVSALKRLDQFEPK